MSASAAASGAGKEALLDQFRRLSENEQCEHILSLLEFVEVHQLRSLYNRIQVLMSFDILSRLPPELSLRVLSYLDAKHLCAVAQCCHGWRDMANRDELWIKLCRQKGYDKMLNLQRPAWAEHSRPTSPPHYTIPSLPSSSSLAAAGGATGLPPMCRWCRVYAEAHTLQRNWAVGVYTAAPLLRGHKQRVTCIANEDEEQLVSGSSDGSVRVWNIDSLKCVHTLEGHTADVNCLVAQDGVIVTGCADGLVRVFDLRTGQCINSLHGHSGSVEHVVLSGRTLVSAGSDWSVRVWDVHSGKLRHTLTAHTEEVEVLRLCGGGEMALSGSWDHSLRVWDTVTGICTHTLLGHTEVVSCCEGEWERREGGVKRAVSGGGDGRVKLWDLQDGRELLSMAGHTAEVVCVQFNSIAIVSGSTDSKIRVWDYQGSCRWVLEGHIGVVRCLCLRGDRLVSGGDRKRIVVWDVKSGKQLHTVHRQQSLLHRMLVTDTKIITASPDSPGTISIISYW